MTHKMIIPMNTFFDFLLGFLLFINMSSFVAGLTATSPAPVKTIPMKGNPSIVNFGYSVKSAGDINKDGYDDVIVGASGSSGLTNTKGAVYVIYGGEDSSLSEFDFSTLSALDPLTTGFIISANAAGDYFGNSVDGAGDINNDGYDDIIIGAPYSNSNKGTVYIIYGAPKSAMSNIDLSIKTLAPLTTGFTITGNTASDKLGSAVSSAGDINKDGYDDILIGASPKSSNRGAAYVVYGGPKASMTNIDLSTALDPTTTGFMMTGNAAGDYFGRSVSSAGDINKDGYADIIIGTYGKNNNQGAAYVIYGGEKSAMANLNFASDPTLDPATKGFIVTGNAGGDYFGSSVGAGDFNKDGYSDLIIGAQGQSSFKGAIYVVYGGANSVMSNIDLSSQVLQPATTGFIIRGNAASDYFGYSVSSGDINQDGYDDMITGAYWKGTKGAVYVVYGGEKSAMSNIDLASSTLDPLTKGFSVSGTNAGDRVGTSVDAVDMNGDGVPDLIVSSYGENSYAGAAYVVMYHFCSANCAVCPSASICSVCSPGYALENYACSPCPTNCETCSVSTSCEVCKSPNVLYEGQCLQSCPAQMFNLGGECQDCSTGCSQCTDLSTCQACITGYTLTESQCAPLICPIKTFASNGECQDCPEECTQCTDFSTCQGCINGYSLTNSGKCKKKVETPKTEEVEEKGSEKAAAGAFEGVSIVGSALGSGSSLPLNFGLVAKILRNIKYMKLPVSRELYETFLSWKVASGFLSAPKSWKEKYTSKNIPTVFSRYELQAAFMINFWKPLMMALIGVGLFAIFKVIEASMKNKKNTISNISKQVNVAASNFALTQFYSNLDDVLFYFILEMRSTKFETGFRIGSSALAIVLFLVGGIFMILHSKILGRYQKVKEASSTPQLEDFVSRFANINLIFKDFKDTNSLTQSFLMINVGRSVLSSSIFATLFEYPIIQISFLIVLNLLMIVYLWNLKSFQEFSNTLSQMFCEIVLFIANICVFLLALFDHAEAYPVTSIERIGKCIIALNLILLVGCALLMVVNVGKMLYKIYQDKKKAKQPQQNILPTIKILSSERFNQSLAQSNQSLSTNLGGSGVNESQNNIPSRNSLNIPGNNENNILNKRHQLGIPKNFSIHNPARSKNLMSLTPQTDTLEMSNSSFVEQPSQIENLGETSFTSNDLYFGSKLMRNRQSTKLRIAQITGMKDNSLRIQETSIHSRKALNQESSISQDVSLINFE